MPSGNDVILIWGGNGWIAGLLFEQLQKLDHFVYSTTVRMENRDDVEAELTRINPTHVLNCAGVTGRPNVDWCEDNKEATVRSNVIGTLTLADCCFQRGIHCTVYATGCIYTYDDAHQMYTGIGFSEIDTPNFSGSYYSLTKTHAESLLTSAYGSNTLILRLRMPVSDNLHPRSFVTKISQYERVVDIPNSNTVLHDLLPCSVALALSNEVGVYNFTNPGAISHNEVLTLFERIVQPGFTWKNFSLEEQAKVIKAERSNCELDTSKLVNKMRQCGIEIPEVHAAYEQCFQRMADNMRGAGANVRNRNMLASTSNTSTDPIAHPGQQNRDRGREQTDGARGTAPVGAPQTVTATWTDS